MDAIRCRSSREKTKASTHLVAVEVVLVTRVLGCNAQGFADVAVDVVVVVVAESTVGYMSRSKGSTPAEVSIS
jgi:hypothetical protein